MLQDFRARKLSAKEGCLCVDVSMISADPSGPRHPYLAAASLYALLYKTNQLLPVDNNGRSRTLSGIFFFGMASAFTNEVGEEDQT